MYDGLYQLLLINRTQINTKLLQFISWLVILHNFQIKLCHTFECNIITSLGGNRVSIKSFHFATKLKISVLKVRNCYITLPKWTIQLYILSFWIPLSTQINYSVFILAFLHIHRYFSSVLLCTLCSKKNHILIQIKSFLEYF